MLSYVSVNSKEEKSKTEKDKSLSKDEVWMANVSLLAEVAVKV